MTSSKKIPNRKALNIAICPICGQPNQYAMAVDPYATECWCEDVEFPRDLLDQIPDSAVRKTCVCQKCLVRYQESEDIPDKQL